MHSREDSVRGNEQQKREREERYARRTRQRTTGEEEYRNASEPPAVGSHTTKPIHHRSQSEGGSNDRTYKGDKDTNEDNSLQGESEDEDDLIIGTPLGTYVLRTKGKSENTRMHTPESGVQDKGKTHQRPHFFEIHKIVSSTNTMSFFVGYYVPASILALNANLSPSTSLSTFTGVVVIFWFSYLLSCGCTISLKGLVHPITFCLGYPTINEDGHVFPAQCRMAVDIGVEVGVLFTIFPQQIITRHIHSSIPHFNLMFLLYQHVRLPPSKCPSEGQVQKTKAAQSQHSTQYSNQISP